MKIAVIKQKANEFLVVNKYHPILLYAAVSSIVASFAVLTIILTVLVAKWLWVISLLFFIALYLLSAPLEVSQADYYLRSYNRKIEETFVFYSGFKKEYYKKAVLIRLIRSLLVILGLPFVIFPGAFLSVRTAYVYEILRLNPKLKVIDIFKESNLLVKSGELSFFLTAASFTGWWILSLITLGAVSVYASPYYRTAKSIFFRNVILQKEDNDKNYLNDLKAHLNSILSSEIANMEKKIKTMEVQHKSVIPVVENEEEVSYESSLKNKTFAPITPPFLQTKSASGEKIYMDDIGDIRGLMSADSMVDEVEIPQISTPKRSYSMPKEEYAAALTSDMEQMTNESLDDFRSRVEHMRRLRDRERAKTHAGVTASDQTPHAPVMSDDSIETEEEELRLLLEEEEAIRLAQMEEEANKADEAKIPKTAKPLIFDDVFKTEKLDIAIADNDNDDTVSTTIITRAEKTTTTVSDSSVKTAEPRSQRTTETTTKTTATIIPKTTTAPQNIDTQKNGTTILSQPKRLTREEILEKIRLEREQKNQKQ